MIFNDNSPGVIVRGVAAVKASVEAIR